MAEVKKCDHCGSLTTVGNPVKREGSTLVLSSGGDENNSNYHLAIYIPIPAKWRGTDLCSTCSKEIITSRFSDLCAMLAPYQPSRVSGFIQDGVAGDEKMTKEERKVLMSLAARMLKA